ncbi:MAG: glucosamine-6-phosphate deaminase, partial [Gemmatimonadaceae bacterium]|nr:glucosamine-6-phosphate deaminase [Chitinophagaceae bacterium]
MSMVDSLEKIPVIIYPSLKEGSVFIAQQIAEIIRAKQALNQKCVLGLATGSSPKTVYAELVRMHREEGLSFRNVVTFNLDEYYPIDNDALQSYNRYMKEQLFDKVDIDQKNTHVPDGEVAKENIKKFCADYDAMIEAAGGLDLQILGIGSNGHIGFNEPGSSLFSKTRLVPLENSTRMANAQEFQNISRVPRLAITMGISTIMKAKKILLMAWGQMKAPVIFKSVEGMVTEQIPASLLQQHADTTFVLDETAATELTRIKSPWLTGECEWTPTMVKKAVVNMALKLGKPVLSLTSSDYNDNGLSDLLVE